MTNAEYQRTWRENNREKALAYRRKWRTNNREKHLASNRAWVKKNREKIKEYARKYRVGHSEQIVRWKKENREHVKNYQRKRYADIKRWRERHREKSHAHNAVRKAIKRGCLVRPELCSKCGKVGKVEAHHANYKRRLDVVWLCRPCHRGLHDRRKTRPQRTI